MTLVRWNPTREIDALQREMNRLFDDVFSPSHRWHNDAGFTPAAELQEKANAYELKLEVPGLEKEDLDVQVTDDSVTISGERKSSTRTEEDGTVRSEFRYGSFQRTIALPGSINHQGSKADYKDGILVLHLPKAEEEKNKVVKVNIH